MPLGILELGLGATLVLTSEHDGSLSTWLASAWALIGGVVLVADALAIRRRLLTAGSGVLDSSRAVRPPPEWRWSSSRQRLEIGDVVLDLGDGAGKVDATVARNIDRTDTTVRATMRAEGREEFVKEWLSTRSSPSCAAHKRSGKLTAARND